MNTRDAAAIRAAEPLPDAGAVELEIRPTTQLVELDGVSTRLWKGTAANGAQVVCLVAQVWVDMHHSSEEQDAEFRRLLRRAIEPRSDGETPEPISLRLIL